MVDLDQFRRSYLTAPVFWYRMIRSVETISNNDVHRASVDRDVKALFEGVLPLWYLVRFLDIPERRVRCRYFGQGEWRYEAKIRLKGKRINLGFEKPLYYIEVTSAQFPKTHLVREALGQNGAVFADPNIRPTKTKHHGDRRVVSNGVAVDGESAIQNTQK